MIGLEYETIKLHEDEEPDLEGWYLPSRIDPAKGTIVFLHGNAENISTHIRSIHWLPGEGFNVLMTEYRGYGGSAGEPDIAGVHKDALRFLQYAAEHNQDKLPLILYGQSLGASIALRVASETTVPLALVVSESGFTTYRSAARGSLRGLWVFRYLFYPFSIFISDEYSPLASLASISAPVLFVHGEDDEIISVEHSKELHQQLPNSTLWLVPDRGHLGLFSTAENRKQLIRYMERAIE